MTYLEQVARALAHSKGATITGPSRHRASDEFPWDPNHRYMQKYIEAHWQDKDIQHAAGFALQAIADRMEKDGLVLVDLSTCNTIEPGEWLQAA